MVAIKQAELMQKHGGRCLLRPVRAHQSEQTGVLGRGAVKVTGAKMEHLGNGRKMLPIFKFKPCKNVLIDSQNKSIHIKMIIMGKKTYVIASIVHEKLLFKVNPECYSAYILSPILQYILCAPMSPRQIPVH